MANYADLDQLIADYLPEVGTNTEKRAALGRVLLAVTGGIDRFCKRPEQYFAPAAEQKSPKVFLGEGKNALRIPIHVAGSIDQAEGVDCGGHLITNWVEMNGWLYMTYRLGKLGGIWQRGTMYTVTARWGYATTPPEISEACRLWAVHCYERQNGTIGQVTPNGFVIERDMPPTVKTWLTPFKRKEFEVQ